MSGRVETDSFKGEAWFYESSSGDNPHAKYLRTVATMAEGFLETWNETPDLLPLPENINPTLIFPDFSAEWLEDELEVSNIHLSEQGYNQWEEKKPGHLFFDEREKFLRYRVFDQAGAILSDTIQIWDDKQRCLEIGRDYVMISDIFLNPVAYTTAERSDMALFQWELTDMDRYGFVLKQGETKTPDFYEQYNHNYTIDGPFVYWDSCTTTRQQYDPSSASHHRIERTLKANGVEHIKAIRVLDSKKIHGQGEYLKLDVTVDPSGEIEQSHITSSTLTSEVEPLDLMDLVVLANKYPDYPIFQNTDDSVIFESVDDEDGTWFVRVDADFKIEAVNFVVAEN